MKFSLEVDLTAQADPAKELARILRYWAGAVTQVELGPGAGSDIYDSKYEKVGRWSIDGPTES